MKILRKTLICKRCSDLSSKTCWCDECGERCCDHTVTMVEYEIEVEHPSYNMKEPYFNMRKGWLCIQCFQKAEEVDDR